MTIPSIVLFAALGAAQAIWAESTYFRCTYTSKASRDGVKADSLQAHFILDSGRKKAYVSRGKQNFEIQHYVNVKDTLVTFVEVTPGRSVVVATVNGSWQSTYSLGFSQYHGFCKVE